MKIWGLELTDFYVLLVYLIGITALGVWMARRVKSVADYIMPRKFGKLLMMMHAFGTGTHSDQAVSVAAKTYTNGLSGIWYQWLWLFCTPFYWLIAPVMRRFRALTTADVFEARYDRSVAMLFALVGVINLTFNIGLMLKGSGAVLTASTGGAISTDAAIYIMTALFVTYGVAGGLSAAIVTDFVQGILTIVFSFILLPSILNAVGGLSGLHEKITDPHMFSLKSPAEIGTFYIIIIAFNGLVGIVTQPHTMGNCAAGRTELDGQVGFMIGTFIKRFCTIAWCLTGLAAVAYLAGKDVNPDNIYGLVAGDFLPKIMPGMLGIFLATLLASVMSSCDSFMIASSALFTENVYKHIAPEKEDKHYVLVARIASAVIVASGVAFAYLVPNVRAGLEIFWKISPMMGIAFWLGLFWRRTTVAGAWAATLTALATWWLTAQGFFISFLQRFSLTESLRFLIEKEGKQVVYLPWQMIFYLAAGTCAGVIVSLLTRRVDDAKLENYFALTRTPVQPGEEVRAACTLPEGAQVPPRRCVFPSSSFEIPIPGLKAILGFAGGWALVFAIIYLVKFIAS